MAAFATPNSSSTLTWDSGSQAILQRLVSSANSSGAGTKIVLSVGGTSYATLVKHELTDFGLAFSIGWSGSYWFRFVTGSMVEGI